MKRIILLILPFLLISCVGSPLRILIMGEQKFDDDIIQLCAAYGSSRSNFIRAELESRDVITDEEWKLIDAKKIHSGISIYALYASWGPPTKIDRSVGGWGMHIRHIYGSNLIYCSPTYVYTINGEISSWQD